MPSPPSPRLALVGAERVGIVLLTGIGDVVHGLPIANDLKRANPTHRVLWVAEPAPARVLDHHPAVDDVVVFQKGQGVAGLVALAAALRTRRCDVTLNMQRYAKSVFPTMFSGARTRVGLPPSRTRDGVSLFNTHNLTEREWCHTQDLLLGYRDALGLPTDAAVEWQITFSRQEEEERDGFFSALGDAPVVGLVLATANPKKDWPGQRYRELARVLKNMGYTVLLIGGPSERERTLGAELTEDPEVRAVSSLGDSVRRMMWTVAGVDLLISPDTGPLHLAHALETPVIGLFGHTNPARVGPWRSFRDLVVDRYTEPGANPDPSAYEPKRGRMEQIAVKDVLAMVEHATEAYGLRRSLHR